MHFIIGPKSLHNKNYELYKEEEYSCDFIPYENKEVDWVTLYLFMVKQQAKCKNVKHAAL